MTARSIIDFIARPWLLSGFLHLAQGAINAFEEHLDVGEAASIGGCLASGKQLIIDLTIADDTVSGAGADEVILGLRGHDILRGRNGDDCL